MKSNDYVSRSKVYELVYDMRGFVREDVLADALKKIQALPVGNPQKFTLRDALMLCEVRRWDSFYVRDSKAESHHLFDHEYIMGVNEPDEKVLNRLEVKLIRWYHESFLFVTD